MIAKAYNTMINLQTEMRAESKIGGKHLRIKLQNLDYFTYELMVVLLAL
jgi:hypothetical protein